MHPAVIEMLQAKQGDPIARDRIRNLRAQSRADWLKLVSHVEDVFTARWTQRSDETLAAWDERVRPEVAAVIESGYDELVPIALPPTLFTLLRLAEPRSATAS